MTTVIFELTGLKDLLPTLTNNIGPLELLATTIIKGFGIKA
jgi:hypothetical protein